MYTTPRSAIRGASSTSASFANDSSQDRAFVQSDEYRAHRARNTYSRVFFLRFGELERARRAAAAASGSCAEGQTAVPDVAQASERLRGRLPDPVQPPVSRAALAVTDGGPAAPAQLLPAILPRGADDINAEREQEDAATTTAGSF